YANISYSSILDSDLPGERPLLEIRNRRIPSLPPWENEIKNLEALLEAETGMKKTAEAKNAELGKELENLRALFSDLQVSNDRLSQWVIGHGLRLAVMKCGESTMLRQVFANVVSAWIAKGGFKVSHGGSAGELKDAPIDVIMASLHLKSDTGDDAPQWIRELRPSSSQLKIPMYLELRDPKDPCAFKEEILLADAIAANVSRAEKKKKCRVGRAHFDAGFLVGKDDQRPGDSLDCNGFNLFMLCDLDHEP
nr:hypothetical protein [Tanacetum cinerariifolium]